ncbi:hypothetical protein ACHAWF_007134 [Thalassiosira exigua]
MKTMLSSSKRLSLWLLPPEPLRSTLSSIQAEINASHAHKRHMPRFDPHVTLIGGVPIANCCSEGELQSLNAQSDDFNEAAGRLVLRRLQRAFQSHGEISCRFVKERGVFAEHSLSESGERVVKWNQSCVSVAERTSSIMRAMEVADEALFSTLGTACCDDPTQSIERHLKGPLFEPHYSFAYGNDAHLIPSSLECPPTFACVEMVLMWTHPSSLEGVEKWTEIGRVGTATPTCTSSPRKTGVYSRAVSMSPVPLGKDDSESEEEAVVLSTCEHSNSAQNVSVVSPSLKRMRSDDCDVNLAVVKSEEEHVSRADHRTQYPLTDITQLGPNKRHRKMVGDEMVKSSTFELDKNYC